MLIEARTLCIHFMHTYYKLLTYISSTIWFTWQEIRFMTIILRQVCANFIFRSILLSLSYIWKGREWSCNDNGLFSVPINPNKIPFCTSSDVHGESWREAFFISKQIIKSSNFRISFKDASLSHWNTIATFLHGQKYQTFLPLLHITSS